MATANLSSRLTMDDSDFNRKARRAADTAKNASDKMRASFAGAAKSFAGIFAGAVTLRGIKALGDQFDRIGKLATRLRQTPEDIQRLGFVASQTGSDLERIAKALDMADRKMGDIKNNRLTGEAAANLGINIQEFLSQDAIGRIAMLAEAFEKANDKSAASADLFKIVGRAASELKPLLNLGAEGVRELGSSIDVLSTEGVRRIEALNDRWDKFIKNLKVSSAEVTLNVVDFLPSMAGAIDAKLGGTERIVSEHGVDIAVQGDTNRRNRERATRDEIARRNAPNASVDAFGDAMAKRAEEKARLSKPALDAFAMMMGISGTIGAGGGDKATLTRKIRGGGAVSPIRVEFPSDAFSSAMSTGRMAGGMAELNAAIASGGNAARSPVLMELKKINEQQENLKKSWDSIARVLTLGIVGG